jgi:hypothetical protein
MAFSPNKKARRMQEELGLETELVFAINPTDRARLIVVPIGSSGQPVSLQWATWNSLIEYISMLDYRLPALQSVLTGHRNATEKRFANVEDELGLVAADMGDGGDVPGGPFTSMCSAVATSLEENRALNRIIAALTEQSKQVAIKVQQARQRASQAALNIAITYFVPRSHVSLGCSDFAIRGLCVLFTHYAGPLFFLWCRHAESKWCKRRLKLYEQLQL